MSSLFSTSIKLHFLLRFSSFCSSHSPFPSYPPHFSRLCYHLPLISFSFFSSFFSHSSCLLSLTPIGDLQSHLFILPPSWVYHSVFDFLFSLSSFLPCMCLTLPSLLLHSLSLILFPLISLVCLQFSHDTTSSVSSLHPTSFRPFLHPFIFFCFVLSTSFCFTLSPFLLSSSLITHFISYLPSILLLSVPPFIFSPLLSASFSSYHSPSLVCFPLLLCPSPFLSSLHSQTLTFPDSLPAYLPPPTLPTTPSCSAFPPTLAFLSFHPHCLPPCLPPVLSSPLSCPCRPHLNMIIQCSVFLVPVFSPPAPRINLPRPRLCCRCREQDE